MRSGNPLNKFARRFVVRILWYEFSTNGKIKNLFVEPLRRVLQTVSRRVQRAGNSKQLLDLGYNAFLLTDRRERNNYLLN